jgi:hypothetical protein
MDLSIAREKLRDVLIISARVKMACAEKVPRQCQKIDAGKAWAIHHASGALPI